MKKVLILVLSCDAAPYGQMIDTALNTWDSINVEGCETKYYCGETGRIKNRHRVIYLPVKESLLNMGEKTIQALEYALKHFEFDYIARVHSSCYVDKKRLIDYIQSLPETNLFSGVEATSQNGFQFLWGGGHYIISKDAVKNITQNRSKWRHQLMEDEAMSLVVSDLGIPFHSGRSCSINKRPDDWLLLSYGGASVEFANWVQIKDCGEHFYRVKQDADRDLDGVIMNELFKVLS